MKPTISILSGNDFISQVDSKVIGVRWYHKAEGHIATLQYAVEEHYTTMRDNAIVAVGVRPKWFDVPTVSFREEAAK